MNPCLSKLYAIASKSERIILGLMSGTSLDGLDLALCKLRGSGAETTLEVLAFTTINYQPDTVNSIRDVFAKRHCDLQQVCLLNAEIGLLHGNMVKQQLIDWQIAPDEVDLIASHGQTIYHAPQSFHQLTHRPNSTLQIGDGDHIARTTGIITISDFRQRHVAAGGEGAPLVVYGDHLLFSAKHENRILLNIGGIANLTYLKAGLPVDKTLSTDIGPGNCLMDSWVQHHFPHWSCDLDAKLATQGKVQPALLETFLASPFFSHPLPKTTGPEQFNLAFIQQGLKQIGNASLATEDILATLNMVTAKSICTTISAITDNEDYALYISGGGIHNPLLLKNIQTLLPDIKIRPTTELGLAPDAKEAALFAVLANECIAGDGLETSMGKICWPR